MSRVDIVPSFAQLSVGDTVDHFFKREQVDLTEYETFLVGLKSRDVSEARIVDGETERAVKRRLTLAARSQGKQLQYSRRTEPGVIVFRVK